MTSKTKPVKVRRFNAFDLFVILVALVAIAGAVYYFMGGGAPDRRDVYFTVELTRMEKGFADKISIGDAINDSVRGYYLGTVYDVEEKPFEPLLFDYANSKFVRVPAEGLYTVVITVKASGTETEAEIKAEDVVVRIGKKIAIKGKGYAQEGYIIGLRTTARGEN